MQTLEELRIDAENRRKFNQENNNHDEAFLQQERQEIDAFLRQIRTARSLEKNLIEMEESFNATESSEPLSEDDEVYSVKNQTMVLSEKRVILEEEEKEGVDSVIVNDTQTITPETLQKNVLEKDRLEGVSIENENENDSSENDNDSNENDSNENDSSNDKENDSQRDESTHVRTPVLFGPKKEVVKPKVVKPKTKSSLSKAMKELTQYEKELFQTIQKLKSKPKPKPTPKKPEPLVASSATWTNQDGIAAILFQLDMERAARKLFAVFEQNPATLAECAGCRLFVGSKEKPYTAKYPCTIPREDSLLVEFPTGALFGITIIATATWRSIRLLTRSVDRLAFLPYLLKRWEG